jgi:hypothetical protein
MEHTMIFKNHYWYHIVPGSADDGDEIAGKWLYFDATPKLHALLDDLDRLVESGRIRATKVARKLPEYDSFPDKPCVLCVYTSDDPEEKRQVKHTLHDELGISVAAWKSDEQTQRDWEEGGWLRLQADINELRRQIESGNVSDVQAAENRYRRLVEQLEQVINSIDDPGRQLEIGMTRSA